VNSIKKLKNELRPAAKLQNSAQRAITIGSIIAEALRTVGQDPVLVGGAAVEFYTQGGYSTSDIDMVTEGGRDLINVMEELGFERIGKDFINSSLKIYIEFPGSALGPSERYSKIKIGDKYLKIISVEDLIIDRLCAYKFWQSMIDGVNALLLLELAEIEDFHLKQRAKEEDVLDVLDYVQKIKEDIIRKNLSRIEANRLLGQGIQKSR
jgi:hypothetical protein